MGPSSTADKGVIQGKKPRFTGRRQMFSFNSASHSMFFLWTRLFFLNWMCIVHGTCLIKGTCSFGLRKKISFSHTSSDHFFPISIHFLPWLFHIPFFYTLISPRNKIFCYKYYIILTHQSSTILGKEIEMNSQRPSIFFNTACIFYLSVNHTAINLCIDPGYKFPFSII